MKNIYKENDKKMDLLKDFNFAMIHIICKMLVLLKNHLHYLKDDIFKHFLRSIINFYFLKKLFFFHNI